jgi:hypothetical protein
MSTKLNTDLNIIELTQAELDSITGGDRYPHTHRRPSLHPVVVRRMLLLRLRKVGHTHRDLVKQVKALRT